MEWLRGVARPRALAFYAMAISMPSALSPLIPYEAQVKLAIAAGFAIAFLIPISAILSRGLRPLDAILFGGIALLALALFQSDLPTRATLENLRHLALILSLALSALYAILIALGDRAGSPRRSAGDLSRFLSVFSATLSSELCSCLHPTLLLGALGVVASIEGQVKLGFVIMMATLAHQAKLTYGALRQRGWPRGPSPRGACVGK